MSARKTRGASDGPPETVAVLGAGFWGTTLAHHMATGGHKVRLWSVEADVIEEIRSSHTHERAFPDTRLSRKIRATPDAREAIEGAELLILAITSAGFREAVSALSGWIGPHHLVLHTSKGLERSTSLRMSEILRQETCCKRFGVLSGPNLAEEVLARQDSGTVVASRYPEVIEAAQRALVQPHFRVYGSRDLVGVELGGPIKNVLAIAMGVAQGLGLGDNTRSLVVTRGLAEMIRLGTALGGETRTFMGISGLGDLIGTCMSPFSVNHEAGERLARGTTLDDLKTSLGRFAEGIPTAGALHDLATRLGIDAPLTEGVYKILHRGAKPDRVLRQLMARAPGSEIDGPPLG